MRRLNRFAAEVELEGRPVLVHVANSGRMQELLQPGNPCYLAAVTKPHRKTPFDLVLVDLGHVLVSADARLPPVLVEEALGEGRLAPFRDYFSVTREVPLGPSRVDLLLEGKKEPCYVEVKSVTLVEAGVGLFPDAPTERGRRHLEALARAVHQGCRAAMIFVVQRMDVSAFAPNERADADFSWALREAQEQGVALYAYRCTVSLQEVQVTDPLPVLL